MVTITNTVLETIRCTWGDSPCRLKLKADAFDKELSLFQEMWLTACSLVCSVLTIHTYAAISIGTTKVLETSNSHRFGQSNGLTDFNITWILQVLFGRETSLNEVLLACKASRHRGNQLGM